MNTYTLAVYGDSPDYIHRFLSYCREHDTFFDVSGFTDPQALLDHVRNCGIDILLLPETGTIKEILQNTPEPIKKIVYLGEQQNLDPSANVINMYQPMSAILEDLKLAASSLGPQLSPVSSDIDITGIYVLDGEGSASDLVTLLSESHDLKGRRMLYIDLDRFSGFSFQHDLSPAGSLSDLIYYYISGTGISAELIRDHCKQTGNIYYLAPPVNGGDPDELPSAKWLPFIKTIAEAGSFSKVIINLRSYCRDMIRMFSICNTVYLFSDFYPTASVGEPSSDKRSFRARAFHDYFLLNERSDILLRLESGIMKTAALAEAASKAPGRAGHFKNRWKRAN